MRGTDLNKYEVTLCQGAQKFLVYFFREPHPLHRLFQTDTLDNDMKWLRLYLVALAVSIASAKTCRPSQPDMSDYLVADTANGAITGHIAPNTTCVVEYLGISYAEPPTGELRFAPPQKRVGDASYEAMEFGKDCPLSASEPVDYPGFTPQAQRVVD